MEKSFEFGKVDYNKGGFYYETNLQRWIIS